MTPGPRSSRDDPTTGGGAAGTSSEPYPFQYGYLLWPLAYSQGTLTFTGDPATLHDPLVDTIPDDAQVLEKTPETTRRDWLPGGFPAWLWDHVRRSSQPLSAATLVLLLALSLMPGRLRDGWYTWSLYLPVMAGVAATLLTQK
jgi:hypothetical protein